MHASYGVPVMFAQLSYDLAVGCAHFVLSEV